VIEFSRDKSLISRRGKLSVQLSLLWTKEVSFQGMSRSIGRRRSRGQLFFFVVSVDFWNLNLCEICWWCMRGQSISIVLSYFHFFLLDVVQQKYKHFADGQGSVLLQYATNCILMQDNSMVQTFFRWIMKYTSDLLDQNRHSNALNLHQFRSIQCECRIVPRDHLRIYSRRFSIFLFLFKFVFGWNF
jgi:hypothetical protein